jgi:hypothetical protein
MMARLMSVRRQSLGLVAGLVTILWAATGTAVDVRTIEKETYRIDIPMDWAPLEEEEKGAAERAAEVLKEKQEGKGDLLGRARVSQVGMQLFGDPSGAVKLAVQDLEMPHAVGPQILASTANFLHGAVGGYRESLKHSGGTIQAFDVTEEPAWIRLDYRTEREGRQIYGRVFIMVDLDGNGHSVQALCTAEGEVAARCQAPIASFRTTRDPEQLRPLDRAEEYGYALGYIVGSVAPLALMAVAIVIAVRYFSRRKSRT